MQYYSVIKKNKSFAICNNMDGLTGIMLSETSQTEKDKYCITYTWTLKIQQTSEYNKKETDSQIYRTT